MTADAPPIDTTASANGSPEGVATVPVKLNVGIVVVVEVVVVVVVVVVVAVVAVEEVESPPGSTWDPGAVQPTRTTARADKRRRDRRTACEATEHYAFTA